MKSFKDELFEGFEVAETFGSRERIPENFEKVETFTDRFNQTYEAGIIGNTAFKLDDKFQKKQTEDRTSLDKTVDVFKDTGQAIATGGEKGIKQMNQSLFSILGSPADFANFIGKSMTGDKDFKGPIPNTKDIQQGFQKLSDWADKYVPVVSSKNIEREYTNKTYSSIIEGISEFASGAIPAAKAVGATKNMKRGLEVTGNILKGNLRIGLGKALPGLVAPSGIVRGATWGAIADAITINPEKGLQNELANAFKEIQPEKRNEIVKATISLLEYDDKNAELVERLRGTLGGLVIGAAVDFGIIPLVKGIYKAAKDAPWEELD
jgi:hypothetical protein